MKLLICWIAFAASALAPPAQTIAQTLPAPPAATNTVGHSAGFDKPVAPATLEGYRGGTSFVSNDMTLAGTTANNAAINVATGSNAISAGAFANMSGIPLVIQNTGANVLIQNAVILNLQMN